MDKIETATADLISIAMLAHTAYRKQKNFKAADWVRNTLETVGVTVECYKDYTRYYHKTQLLREIKVDFET